MIIKYCLIAWKILNTEGNEDGVIFREIFFLFFGCKDEVCLEGKIDARLRVLIFFEEWRWLKGWVDELKIWELADNVISFSGSSVFGLKEMRIEESGERNIFLNEEVEGRAEEIRRNLKKKGKVSKNGLSNFLRQTPK